VEPGEGVNADMYSPVSGNIKKGKTGSEVLQKRGGGTPRGSGSLALSHWNRGVRLLSPEKRGKTSSVPTRPDRGVEVV